MLLRRGARSRLSEIPAGAASGPSRPWLPGLHARRKSDIAFRTIPENPSPAFSSFPRSSSASAIASKSDPTSFPAFCNFRASFSALSPNAPPFFQSAPAMISGSTQSFCPTLSDDVVLVKPGNLSISLISMGWRPIAQADNKQSVVLVGEAEAAKALADGSYSLSLPSPQSLIARTSWALARDMIRDDFIHNVRGGKTEFMFQASQDAVLKSVKGNIVGGVSPAAFEKFKESNPDSKLRVLAKSKALAPWSVLAHPDASRVSNDQIAAIRDALIAMSNNGDGAEILKKLNIKGFSAHNKELSAETIKMIDGKAPVIDAEDKAKLAAARRQKYLSSIQPSWHAELWGVKAQ